MAAFFVFMRIFIEGATKILPFILLLGSIIGSTYTIKTDLAILNTTVKLQHENIDGRLIKVESVVDRIRDKGLLSSVATMAAPLLTIK